MAKYYYRYAILHKEEDRDFVNRFGDLSVDGWLDTLDARKQAIIDRWLEISDDNPMSYLGSTLCIQKIELNVTENCVFISETKDGVEYIAL